MKILLDECIDWHLKKDLEPHETFTVKDLGRSGIENNFYALQKSIPRIFKREDVVYVELNCIAAAFCSVMLLGIQLLS